jgi:hypothetical protein
VWWQCSLLVKHTVTAAVLSSLLQYKSLEGKILVFGFENVMSFDMEVQRKNLSGRLSQI